MKNRIKSAALGLFLKYGPKRTTVDDIIWELQISKKSFYKYFLHKEDLVLSLFKGIVDDTRDELLALNDKEADDLTLLIMWQQQYFAYMQQYSSSCIYELNKYYLELVEHYNYFRKTVVYKNLIMLTKRAQQQGAIRADIKASLFVKQQIYSLEEVLFGRFNLSNLLTVQDQDKYAQHIILNNTRGIIDAQSHGAYEAAVKSADEKEETV